MPVTGTRECKDLVIDIKCDHRNSRPARDTEIELNNNRYLYTQSIYTGDRSSGVVTIV